MIITKGKKQDLYSSTKASDIDNGQCFRAKAQEKKPFSLSANEKS